MKTIPTRDWLFRYLDDLLQMKTLGVSKEQVDEAINRSELRVLPFIYGSIAFLFVAYTVLQLTLLREPGLELIVAGALLSLFILLLFWALLGQERFAPQRAGRLAAVLAFVILVNIQLRFYLTGEPSQAANLALFVFAIGVLFHATRWYLFMLVLSFAALMQAFVFFVDSPDFHYYLVVTLAAAATGFIAHIGRVQAYRRAEMLRILAEQREQELHRLNAQIQQFNQQLEGMVAERTQALQAAYARLERLDKTKTDFITIASHEMLTPLTIINLNAQMFIGDEEIQQNPLFARWAQGIDKGVVRMQEVVDRMLDVAKIDSRSLDLHPAPLDLPFLIRQVANRFRSALAERHLTLEMTAMADLPEIEADAEALQKVFYHLIINGIKYTPDGGRLQIDGRFLRHSSPPSVEIIIADTGIGIAPEAQPFIFDKFYQTGEVMLHSSGKTKFMGGGSGLGLAIVRGIVEAHHGRVWVESPGLHETNCPGSRFHVVLPRHQPS
ncbi:MAG: HAMP domain-containing histidine kinase [Ardenticatenaceae bacterium]|nr:HAMP domain-containing histidine kinase [Ardenticatenaceae bacterium]